MFGLFRRHQKVVLTSVAVLAIGAMGLSAVLPLFMDEESKSYKAHGLIEDEKTGLIVLINHGLDAGGLDIAYPKAFIRDLIFDTGLYKEIYARNKEAIHRDLEPIFASIQNYEFPDIAPSMHLGDFLKRVTPRLSASIDSLRSLQGPIGEAHFEAMSHFFMEKSQISMPALYQYLNQISNNQVSLTKEDLCLLGLKNPEECFGKTFIETAATMIEALAATTLSEMKNSDVSQTMETLLGSYYRQPVSPAQFFMTLGLSPECGILSLKKVAALEEKLQRAALSTWLDPLGYQEVASYAAETIGVKVYSFKEDLLPKSFDEVVALEFYANQDKPIEVETFQVKTRFLDKSQVMKKFPRKKLYTVALADYSELCDLFPYMLTKEVEEDKDKLEAIKKLSGKNKELLEKHLQKKLAAQDPNFYINLLKEVPQEEKKLLCAVGAKSSPLKGFSSQEELLKELKMLPVGSPICFDLQDKYLYEIELIAPSEIQGSLSYLEATKQGILKERIKEQLEGLYKSEVKKNPSKYLTKDKKTKTLDEAYYDLIALKYQDLKKEIMKVNAWEESMMQAALASGYPKLVLDKVRSLETKQDFRIEVIEEHLSRSSPLYPKIKSLFSEIQHSPMLVQDEKGRFILVEKTGHVESSSQDLNFGPLNHLQKEKIEKVLIAELKEKGL